MSSEAPVLSILLPHLLPFLPLSSQLQLRTLSSSVREEVDHILTQGCSDLFGVPLQHGNSGDPCYKLLCWGVYAWLDRLHGIYRSIWRSWQVARAHGDGAYVARAPVLRPALSAPGARPPASVVQDRGLPLERHVGIDSLPLPWSRVFSLLSRFNLLAQRGVSKLRAFSRAAMLLPQHAFTYLSLPDDFMQDVAAQVLQAEEVADLQNAMAQAWVPLMSMLVAVGDGLACQRRTYRMQLPIAARPRNVVYTLRQLLPMAGPEATWRLKALRPPEDLPLLRPYLLPRHVALAERHALSAAPRVLHSGMYALGMWCAETQAAAAPDAGEWRQAARVQWWISPWTPRSPAGTQHAMGAWPTPQAIVTLEVAWLQPDAAVLDAAQEQLSAALRDYVAADAQWQRLVLWPCVAAAWRRMRWLMEQYALVAGYMQEWEERLPLDGAAARPAAVMTAATGAAAAQWGQT